MAIFERFNRAILDGGAPRIVDSLVAQLRTKGITVVDPTDDLVSADPGFEVARLFMPGGHYSPLGNRRIAGVLGRYIEQNIEPMVRASRLAKGVVVERATDNPCCPQGSR